MKPNRPLIVLSVLIVGALLIGSQLATTVPSNSRPPVAAKLVTPNAITTVTAAAAPAQAAVPSQPLFKAHSWAPVLRNPQPLRADEPVAERMIHARGQIEIASLPVVAKLKAGDVVSLPLRDGTVVEGRVNLVKVDANGAVRAGGGLITGAKGSFSLGQRGASYGGLVQLPEKQLAYVLSTEANGSVSILEKPLSSVRCEGMKPKPQTPGERAAALAAPPPAPGTDAGVVTVPVLDSRPGSAHVIYLDFDGEVVNDPDWNDGFPIHAEPVKLGAAYITAAHITDIWKRVAEDYRIFDISITTSRARYDAVPPGQRMRCIVTSTYYWMNGAAGVAFLGSYDQAGNAFDSEVPSWAFPLYNYTTADISGIISHEIGHTMGLSHDAVLNPVTGFIDDEYFGGHARWGPIMGTTYDRPVGQWSMCEYLNGTNYEDAAFPDDPPTLFKEDDIAIIGGTDNGFGFVPTTPSNTTSANNSGTFAYNGVISRPPTLADDTGFRFRFSSRGGAMTLIATPASPEPNLDSQLQLIDANTLAVIATANPSGSLSPSIVRTITPGTYEVRLTRVGEGNPLYTGYSTYGSLGEFNITGSFPAVIDSLPTITAQPQPRQVAELAPATFSVAATSNTGLTYQWQKDGVNILNAKAATYTIPRVVGTLHQGAYRCLVTNLLGTVNSDPASLTIDFKPVITRQPVATTVALSGSVLEMSVLAAGSPTLNYQWQKAGVNLPTQTSATLSIASPQFADGGLYRCVVSNAFGSVTSSQMLAAVTRAPVITVQPPTAKGMPRAGTSTVAITAVGTAAMRYQWYKGTAIVPGAVLPTLTLSRITDLMAGSYTCTVTNAYGSVTSDPCVITVGAGPVILTKPVATTVDAGAQLNLSATASGDPTLNFEWLRDNVVVPGANAATLTIPAATWADRGLYQVRVTNGFSSVTSAAVLVTVRSPAFIVTSPLSRKAARNTATVLTVVAAGSPTLRYQWFKNDVLIPGAAASLTVVATATADYKCRVTNGIGATAESAVCTVTVEDPPTISVLPASVLAALGGTYKYTPAITGSGTPTFQWKKNGVNMPTQINAELNLPNLVATDAAVYTLSVTNDVGTKLSTGLRLTLQTAPAITSASGDLTVSAYAPATFTVVATGTATLRYQWRFNSTNILGAVAATYKVLSALPGSTGNDGLYDCVVTNSVGTAISAPARLTVLPVTPATVTGFRPAAARPGDYLRVQGTNFQWTTAVEFPKAVGLPAKAAFVIVSPDELLVTVPAGVLASNTFSVVTRAGPAAAPTALNISPANTNDLIANARVLPGAGASVTGSLPITFTVEPNEPDSHPFAPDDVYPTAYTAWFHFEPSVSGIYTVSTASSGFDSDLTIYSGNNFGDMVLVGTNDDQDYEGGVYTSYTRVTLTAGQSYIICVDGFKESDGYPLDFGNYRLAVARINSVITEPKATAPVLALSSARPSVVSAPLSTRLRYSRSLGSTDVLTLQPFAGGASLQLAANTGALSLRLPTGALISTGQTLLPGTDYTLQVDSGEAPETWQAFVNGEPVMEALSHGPSCSLTGVQVQVSGSSPAASTFVLIPAAQP